LPIVAFNTAANTPKKSSQKTMGKITLGKHPMDRGVPALRIMFENRKWRIPRGDAHSIEVTDHWIGEMGAMAIADGKVMSVGSHDDTVMATWMSDAAARHGAQFRFVDDSTPEEKALADEIARIEAEEAAAKLDQEEKSEYTVGDRTLRFF
jgi:hypothetical protein